MVRRVIHIDQEKCNGCGICANACHEGAIGIVDGKAQLLRDDYCDGLGDCLPTCPTGAITFVEREAAAYDEAAVKAHMERRKQEQAATQASDTHSSAVQEASASTGCPGSRARQIVHEETPAFTGCPGSRSRQIDHAEEAAEAAQNEAAAPCSMQSQLTNWPVQIKLAPVRAPYFNHARLLIAADCTAYAYANFHQEFLKGKVALIGCPKLDDVDYSDRDHPQQRYPECHHCPHGGSLLRRSAACSYDGAAEQRKVHSVAGCYDFYRRKDFGPGILSRSLYG